MEKVFHHYSEWEDFKHGLYRLPCVQDSQHQVLLSASLLGSPAAFYNVSLSMISEWGVSAEVNLSNRSRNRQAWIGQAACCFNHKAAEHQTKEAWWMLSKEQQQAANEAADCVIEIWERFYA
jgi:hypothetical protein